LENGKPRGRNPKPFHAGGLLLAGKGLAGEVKGLPSTRRLSPGGRDKIFRNIPNLALFRWRQLG
jgi:hypothetical protein